MNRTPKNSPPHGLEEVYAKYKPYFVRIAVSYVSDRRPKTSSRTLF